MLIGRFELPTSTPYQGCALPTGNHENAWWLGITSFDRLGVVSSPTLTVGTRTLPCAALAVWQGQIYFFTALSPLYSPPLPSISSTNR